MSNKNDQYQMYIDENKTVYYYKNKELHRKNGPAIVKLNERENNQIENDDGLYSIIFNPISNKTHVVNNSDVIQVPLIGNKVKKILENVRNEQSSIISFTNQPNKTFSDSPYFLDGLNYSKSEFDRIISKETMHNGLRKARM